MQSEKLASIGQLVGGAAHEINNPLTAILGYSELLADDPTVGDKTRSLAEKIREQARRTKTLVNNLLSFARQVPSEQRSPLDINTIVNTSAQFRRFDLRGKNIRIEVQTGAGIPEVRADMNQLLQVFSNIINNAVYAMQEAGGGTLTVRTLFEKGNVVILFSDTGPGMRDPASRLRPVLHDQAGRKGHRAGPEHLLRADSGSGRTNLLLQPARGRRDVPHRASRRSRGVPVLASQRYVAGGSQQSRKARLNAPRLRQACTGTGSSWSLPARLVRRFSYNFWP